MSQSNYPPVVPSGNSDATSAEDESHLEESSLTKLSGTASPALNFLQVFKDRIDVSEIPVLGTSCETLSLQCQKPCEKISLKSLPSLGAKDSLENIFKIQKYSEFPLRNLLGTFVKADYIERRPRRRLCQNKAETGRSDETNPLKSQPCPEVNARKLRYQLTKEKKVLNTLSIGRLGEKIRNRLRGEALKGNFGNALYQGLSYAEVVSICKDDAINLQISPNNSNALTSGSRLIVRPALPRTKLQAKAHIALDETYAGKEMLHSLEKLSLYPAKPEENVGPESLLTPEQTPNDPLDRADLLKERDDKRKLEFQELNEVNCKIVCSPRTEEAVDKSSINLQSCAFRLDFSSGDDSRNLGSKLTTDGVGVCKATCVEERRIQDYESRRRSVQWNSEVDVIYYAGDRDGGKVVRRKMELLHEEADQQARRNNFIKLALNKNLISAFNAYKFLNP